VHFADVPAQIAMYASAMSGVPFTIMAHANDIFERGLLLRQKADRAVKMATISEFNRVFLESAGVPGDKLAIVRCGVSFQPLPSARQFQRQEVYRLGTLGRMVEKKGFDVLIRAIAELRNRPYRIELSIAGDGPLRGELKALADALDMTQFVTFEGALAHSDVAGWMRGLDAFVLACKKDRNGDMDGIPVVLMEAMSQSVPVISTRISGIPELIIHDRTGLLANPDDHRDLSAQIERLMEFPDLRERFVREAAGHVEKEFGQNVNLRRLLNCFPAVTRQGTTLQMQSS
jgi:glycosyltransferase involved in cell wall biosynthesis